MDLARILLFSVIQFWPCGWGYDREKASYDSGRQILGAMSPRLTLTPNICSSSVWFWRRVTILIPRILRWLLDFWKIWGPFSYKKNGNSPISEATDFNNPMLSFRPPLWFSGQSFWLQIQRSRVRFPALPDFLSSSGSGTGSTQPREIN